MTCKCHSSVEDHVQSVKYRFNRIMKTDPTRTATLRRAFAGEMGRRYSRLSALIRDAVYTKDVFGLGERTNIFAGLAANVDSGLAPGAFAFRTAPEKVDDFMAWVGQQVDREILSIEVGPRRAVTAANAWTNTYITSSYKKGMRRADSELRKVGVELSGELEAWNVDAAFNRPIHADRVGLLYTRTWNELKGGAGRLEQRLQRTLSEQLALGMAEGRGPLEVARALTHEVGLEKNYAKTLARTEIIRAHHVANINTYREAGVEGVVVRAEWSTSGFNVCPDCADMNGRIFTLNEIEGLIPFHPNCRCAALPIPLGVDVKTGKFDPGTIGKQYKDKAGIAKKRGLFDKAVQGRFKKPRRKLL